MKRLTALLLALLPLPALAPLLRAGFFVSDDGRFHVYRAAALADAWRLGVLHPRLFPTFGFGYGQAVLNFYAPLAYWPPAVFSLLRVPPAAAVELAFGLGFVLAALAAYGYARSLWGPWGGLLAAVTYTYFPYHLADVYVRGALPEHFAFVWPPLILWAATDLFRKERPLAPAVWGALAWAGLIFTHNLTALLMLPVWVFYVMLLAAWTRRPRGVLHGGLTLILGVGLSAPLWLPYFAESRYVGLALGPSDGYKAHLAPLAQFVQAALFYRYRGAAPALSPEAARPDYPLSWLVLLLVVVVLVLYLWRARRLSFRRGFSFPIVGFGLLLVIASALMTTAASLSLWQPLTPILGMLQYPWRFLVLTAVGLAPVAGALPELLICGGAVGDRPEPRLSQPSRVLPLVLLAAMLMIQPLPGVPLEPLPFSRVDALMPDRMWQEDLAAGQVGATWTGEFLPLTVTEQRWALGRPREGAVDTPAPTVRPVVTVEQVGYDSLILAIQTGAPATVSLHQFYLPMWRAMVDGAAVTTYPTGELGLVSADVPAGSHQVALAFGPTSAWHLAGALGLLSVLVWAALAWMGLPPSRFSRIAAVALACFALVLALNGWGLGAGRWTPQPVQVAVGDVAQLAGYDVALAPDVPALDVTLYWYALRETGTNYKVFVHALGPDGRVIGQHDGDPVGGFTPTTRWRSGEVIVDRHRVPLPEGLSGDVGLRAGMYQPEPVQNLPLDPPTADGRVDLGSVTVSVTR